MHRSPSIVPREAGQDIHLVLDDFGARLGRAWRETDEEGTDRETLISANPSATTSRMTQLSC
jgi:hypothetical protein